MTLQFLILCAPHRVLSLLMEASTLHQSFFQVLRARLPDVQRLSCLEWITFLSSSPSPSNLEMKHAFRQIRFLLLGNDDVWMMFLSLLPDDAVLSLFFLLLLTSAFASHSLKQAMATSLYPLQVPASHVAQNVLQSFRLSHQTRLPSSPEFSASAFINRIQVLSPR